MFQKRFEIEPIHVEPDDLLWSLQIDPLTAVEFIYQIENHPIHSNVHRNEIEEIEKSTFKKLGVYNSEGRLQLLERYRRKRKERTNFPFKYPGRQKASYNRCKGRFIKRGNL